MRKPSREPQPLSWREIVVTIHRGFRRGRDASGSARRAWARWIAGGLLCVGLVSGISLARHGGKKKDSAARKTRSPLGDTVSARNTAENTAKSVVSVEKTPKPEKRHSSSVLIQSAQKIKGSETPSPKVEVERRAAVGAPPRQIVLAPPLSALDTTEGVKEDSDVSRKRGSWFFDQRAYPIKHIPEGALQRAIEQRDAMKAQQLAAGPQTGANGIISFPGDALWHLMGPQPVNEPFTGTNTGYPTAAGRVTAITVDPSTPSTVYIGGAAGGVWKTTDGGTTWTPLTDSQPSLAVGSITIDPNSCSPAPCTTIYVGTGEDNFNGDAFYGAGVLKSMNGGNTWTQLGGPFAGAQSPTFGGAQIGAIAVQPGNSNIVLAAAYFFDGNDPRGGIYRSTDGGATWSLPTTGAKGSAGTGVVFESSGVGANPPIAWAALGDVFSGASSNGIWKSTDLGVTWTLQTSVLPTVNVGRITLGYAANTTGATATLYAAIADSSTTSSKLLGLFKTTNGGTTWSALTGPTVTGGFCASQCFYDMAVGVQPTNASVVVLGGGPGPDNFTSLFESQDGGTTWTPSGTPGSPSPGNFANGSTTTHVHVDTHAVVFAPNGGTLYVGDDGGIWSTTTPTPASTVSPTWTDLNGGLAITQFYPGPSAGISDDNYGLGGTQDNDTEIFTGALGWTNAFTCGDGGSTAIDPAVPTTVYTTCDRGAQHVVNKSVFNGALLPNPTFRAADSGISHGDRMQFIPPLTIDENNPNTLYFGTFRVYQTNDGAATWTAISGDLGAGVGNITTFDVAHQSSSIVVTGTSTGKVWESLTATAGVASTWTEIDNGQLPNRHITSVRTLRSDATGNVVYATLSGFGSCAGCAPAGHVFVTTNATSGAPTWTNISGDLPDIPVNDLIVFHQGNPSAYDALYIATDVGVFSCTNPAATLCANWTVIGDGLPNSPVLGLAMRRPSRILRAATHGRSMWQIQLTDVSPGPLATITSVTPATAFVGDPATAVTINGFNFSANTAVFLNGVSVGTPTFVSTTQLNVTLASTFFQTGGVFPINLMDPAGVDPSFVLGGAGGAPFTVMNPILGTPTLTNPATSAGTPYTMHFTGSNFVNSTVVTITTFGNLPLTGTASSNGTVFDVAVPAALLTTAMSVSGTITNPVPGGGPTPAFSFNFTINSGTIVFNPSPIALTAFLGTTSSPVMNVAVINTSASSVNITAQSIGGANATNFSFAAPTSGTSCNFPTSGQSGTGAITLTANGGTCNFGITYTAGTPPGNAVSNATLSVTDTASGSPQTAPIQGTPLPATVFLTPVNFGAVPVGTTSATMNATLSNSSGSSISVTSAFTVNGTNQADFNIVPFVSNGDGNSVCPTTVPFPLASGASCDVSLAFTPSLPAGNESAQLNVTASVAVSTSAPNLIGVGIEVTSISPSIVATGGPAFTLTVNGGGFAPSAVVNVNGSARLTTFVSATQLLASIPAADIATAGTLAITVTTPVPGGTTSEPKTLFVARAPSATNDNINFAINASTTPFRITQDTTQATTDTGGVADPTPCAPASKARSVWFKFVAPASGRMVADTRFSSYTTILSAWTGTPGSLVAVPGACASGNVPAAGASPAQSLIGFNVTSGTTYFVMVTDANTSGPGGTLTFSMDFSSAAPANDDNATPTVISATPFSNTVNSILATANTNAHADPTLPGGCATGAVSSGQANSVWYSFTPSGNGTITADTLTSPYETILNVTSGSAAGAQVACNQSAAAGIAQSQVSFAATSGTPYFFMISSVLGDGGTTNFHLAFSAVSAPGVSFSPTNIAFGNQKVGTTSATNNVTITNNGTATLNITGITLAGATPGDFTLGSPTTGTACPLGASSLTAGSNCAVGVAFKPTAAGARSASVSVADNASGSPQTVPLTGTGTASAVTLAPTSVAFGNQVVSTQSAVTNVMITNGGTATLNITSITLTGTNPGDFSLGAPTTGTACGLGASSLNAGSNCSFGVSFGPTAAGARSASVSIADDASGSPQTVALTGTGTAANVTLSPSPVNFSNQRINTSSGTTTVTLSNTGNATVILAASNAVTITGMNAGDFAIVAATGTNCSNNLVVAATNGTCVIGVTFTPTATGPRTATLQVSDNATPGTQSVTLNGTGTVPTAGVAPLNISFGNQRKGTTSAGNDVTVSNAGTDTLNVASIALTGANPSQFTLGAPSSGTACTLGAAAAVAPGSNCKFSVKFAPTVIGAQTASVTITDDSGAVAGTVQTVTLTGTGTLPQASAAPNPLAFGNQRKGTTSGAKTVTLTNTGTDTLNLAAANAVVISGANAADFAIVPASTTCKNSSTVAPNGSTCVINITFAPTTTAAEVATLTITDDSGGVAGTTQVVSVTGTGVLPQAGAAPSTLAFGNQPKGITSAPMTVTLTNNGTDTLNLAASNAVAISGTNAADFAVVAATTTCTNGAAVAASTSCVVNITFAPSTTAAESATLTVTDDSGGVAGSSQTVSLTGTGTTATINLTPNPVPFGNQRKGTPSSAQTITVTNSGNGSVTLAASNAVALSGTNAADFAITGGACANSLVLAAAPGPGNTCTITATFTPSTAAVETATVTVSFQGGTPAAPDTLNGTGIYPAVTLTPNTPLSFGNQIITTTSATQSVTVKNTGTDTLNLSAANAVALGGANAAEFSTTGTTCANSQAIPVNGTCNIVVAFSPATAGAKSATVTITDDVSPAQVINLSGTGVTPPTATLSAATLTFAAQHTGTTSAAQSVTVTNSGGANLNIATVAISGTNASDFAIATGTTCTNGSTVNGGASNSCLINVTFTPSAVGARTATITITDNADATGAPGAAQPIILNGTGKAPAITFTPASVPNFGNQRIGTASATNTVTITNSGTDTLNLTSISITGTNASEFTVAGSGATPCPTGPGSLNTTLSCTIAITFKPTATGPRSASVNVTDDASGSPQSLALAGTGTAPAVTLSAASITFPTTAVNSTSAVQSATVTNSGTATLTLGATAVSISGANAGDFAIAAGTTCTNGTAVAVSASCTVNFTFKPTAAGVRNATATITDDAGGAPGSSTTQTITLSGSTPSTATLSSSTVAFGNQGVGVASSAQTITITNNGGAKLNLAAANAVAISGTNPGDFAVASGTTCTNGASVSGSGGTCIINLTFTPGAIGARGPATITITDDAGGVANSTQTVTLTGTGIDFTLAVTTGSQTVKAGSPATFTFTVTPGGGGFPNAITFTTSALPRGAMGAFNPATLTAPITTQQTVILTISTTSRGAAPPAPAAPRVPPVLIFRVLTILFAFLALLIMRRGLRTRRLVSHVPLVLVLAALAVSAGCVGGNANGTPPGTTQVTVTATAGSLTHSTTVSLTVN